MKNKIAIIGAGSIEFTRKLLKDILIVHELEDSTFVLIDIYLKSRGIITRILQVEVFRTL
jgi:alpha-galactosidase